MKYVLGIDGGQSSTTALIADEHGRLVGQGTGGPCNHVAAEAGRAKFSSAICACVTAAASQAGIDPLRTEFAAVCGGFSGGPADKQALLGELVRAGRWEVTTDAAVALAGANAGEPAIVTIAGTGSIAWGRNREGRMARAGGWGYLFGDEGGAFDIVRQALRAALRAEEGWGPATALRELFLRETGAADVNEAMHRMYTPDYPRPRVAAWARGIDEVAAAGDPIAASILHRAAQELAMYAGAVRGQLFAPGEAVLVAWIGGVFGSAMLLERFRMLVELEEGNSCAPPRFSPAAGALLLACRAAGVGPDLATFPSARK